MSLWLFYAFGAVAVIGALGMVLNVRNAVASALCLVATMVALGGVHVLLEAYFVGALQVLVYAGAIVVLFVFVVMLLNLRRDGFPPARARLGRVTAAAVVGAALAGLVGLALTLPETAVPGATAALPEGFGGYRRVGAALFTDYLLAFEATSLLLLSAMVGAVVLAKRRGGDA